jgi:hypothetical protein
MEQQSSDLRELSPEILEAVSGGISETPFSVTWAGLVKGFQEAGGTVTYTPLNYGSQHGGEWTFRP